MPSKTSKEYLHQKAEEDRRAQNAKMAYALARGLDPVTLKPPLDNQPQTGHFSHMNLLLTQARKSCSKHADRASKAEKSLRDITLDRDKWRDRALSAEAKLASLGM
jgi:hypothetical protein